MRSRHRASLVLAGLAAGLALASCFDPGTRWDPDYVAPPPAKTTAVCTPGAERCALGNVEKCASTDDGLGKYQVVTDCASKGLLCVGPLQSPSHDYTCLSCVPGTQTCDGQTTQTCRGDGSGSDPGNTCDPTKGEACREGVCLNLCVAAASTKSNVGCEYWAVDLDNAMIDPTDNAAAQQFAVVVSNAQPDVPTHVQVFQDDGNPGDAPAPMEIAAADIAAYNLQVFKLGPREVDGSPPGQYNTGSNTAVTRHAYKIVTDFPVVAYQFNPLDNVNVFSNDASLLKPREALVVDGEAGLLTSYVVAGWPQTIAATDDPDTNFDPSAPINLRAFLTIVGTRENTNVRVHPKARVVPGGGIKEVQIGDYVDVQLGAFDVLNLETGDFNADFTGSIIEADQAVAVFSGSEASDAPHFEKLADRRCCADHLEQQLDPIRTAGKGFAIAHNPSRTAAVKAAGGDLAVVAEPDFVRFVAAATTGATIKTTLPPPDDEIVLSYRGDFKELTVFGDFMATSTDPIHVAQVMPSQDAAGVKRGLPGGDPSLLIYPPQEQFRSNYVFLTPDKYAFDFVAIVAPPDATVLLDDLPPEAMGCEMAPADGLTAKERGAPEPEYVVYRCQLGFPTIDPLATAPDNVLPGVQNDGVHRVDASEPVGVIVSGFDSYVSYAYAGGTDLKDLGTPK